MKKAIYTPTIVILAFVLLTYAAGLIYLGQSKYDKVIGMTQLEIIDAYKEGEKIKFYVDESVKLARDEAIFELARRGGNFECKGCYLNTDVEENFLKLFKEGLRKYKIKVEDYDISIKDGKIIGKANKKEISINANAIKEYLGEKYAIEGIYYVDTSFSEDLNFDFNVYKEIEEKLKEMKDCVEDISKDECNGWKVERGDILVIEVNTGKKVLNNFKLEEVNVRFNYKRG